jgi:fructokinase
MRIGIDLGGTKIKAIALDDSGAPLDRHRVATPAGDYRGIIEAIAALVAAIEEKLGQSATVGVGTPGSLSLRTGLMRNSNSTVLNGKPLDRDLEGALRRPVRLENDANCFALSEAMDGAGNDTEAVFGVILGTGVGGGLVVGKRLIPGRNRIAGEWGHNPLPWPRGDEQPGPRCYCGKRGCIETFISGPALSRDFRSRTGRNATAGEISAAAGAGDRNASTTLEVFEDRLARGLATVMNIFDPDKIVLGGGLSNIGRVYTNVPLLVERYVFSDAADTAIVRAKFGDSSGVRGAAWLWPVAP